MKIILFPSRWPAGMLLALGLLAPGLAATAHADEVPVLFTPAPAGFPGADQPSGVLAKASRARSVVLNSQALAGLKAGQTNWLRVPVFSDRDYTALLTLGSAQATNSTIWHGTLLGLHNSSVSLVHHRDVVVMDIYDGHDWVYQLKQRSDGAYWLEEMVPGWQGDCGVPTAPPGTPPHANLAPPARSRGPKDPAGNTYVDILLLYTPNARANAGGVANIEARAWAFIHHANSAHERSNTRLRFRNVGMEEIAYDDSSQNLSLHLDRLGNPGDGFMDGAFARREATGADLMCLLPHGRANSGSTLGIAYLGGREGVVEWTQDPSVFTHEIGHNLGCRHEVSNDSGGSYNHGFRQSESWNLVIETVTENRNTIMYSTFNTSTRTDYFSNPGINFTFTGGSCGGLCADVNKPLGLANQADNARWLRENRFTTAAHQAPLFFMYPVPYEGDASQYAPENDLADVYNEWFPNTEVDASATPTIRIAPASYPATIRITRPSRLENWTGSGNVRLGP